MNWVPLFFIDDVCHQLRAKSLRLVSELSGSWVKFSAEHRVKRREFAFNCTVSDEDGAYSLEKHYGPSFSGQFSDLDLDYDRITSATCEQAYRPRRIPVSLNKLENDVLPTVVSLAANCTWRFLQPKLCAKNRFIFNAFKKCAGLDYVCVVEPGAETMEFISQQVQFGNVEELHLETGTRTAWPQSDQLARTLRTFVSSPRFTALITCGPLPNVFELVALFLERALAGELKRGARIRIYDITFEKSQLSALHPEHHHKFEKLTWCIPNSLHRVVDRRKHCSSYVLLTLE